MLVRATEAVAVAVGGPAERQAVRRRSSTPASRSTGSRTRPTRSCATPLADLFREATDPLLVIKWKEIYETLENATDRCEDVANIIEGVVLEHA